MPQNEGPQNPLVLVAELTHRCPLGCPYCWNPLVLDTPDQELDAATWARVFREAAALGVRNVHLSGGEPGARRDLVDIAANAREAGLVTHLISSGVIITTRTMRDLWEAGLDHVHVSFQDAGAVLADHIAGHRGAFQRKSALAAEAVRLGLPLTVSFVVHRANIEHLDAMADLALGLKASRLEFLLARCQGWALKNHAALMPAAEHIQRALVEIADLSHKYQDRLVINVEVPDPRADGWDQCSLTITPKGLILPGYSPEFDLGLELWNVRDHSLADIWANAPACRSIRAAAAMPASGASYEQQPVGAEQTADYVYRRT